MAENSDGPPKKKSKKNIEDHGPNEKEPRKEENEEDKYYYTLYKGLADTESKSRISPAKTKRKLYLSWDNYFMALTYLSAQRSPDPNTQVGACIVDPENRIVGMGYNAMPIGLDHKLPWNRFAERESFENTKHPYVCHAVVNAILSSSAVSLKGCTIYCTLIPSHEDTKLVIQSGISKVVYYDEKYYSKKYAEISRRMLSKAGVSVSQKRWDKSDWSIQPKTSTPSTCCISLLPDLKSDESASDASSRESAPEVITQPPGPRKNFLKANAYYMAVALVSAERSKDPRRQVGACIVNRSGNIVGVGYNRFPKGFGDDDVDVTWDKGDKDPAKNKYSYVCHAEANAILHKSCIDLEGCTIYTTYFPCNECAKLILQSKIEKIVYLESDEDKLYLKISRKLLETAGFEDQDKLKQFGDEIDIKLLLPMMLSISTRRHTY